MRRALALVLALLLALPAVGWAQPAALRTSPKGSTAQGFPTSASVDANIQALDVFIRGGGGSGGTSATDNSVFTGGTTAVTPGGALFDATPPAITDGNVGIFRMNASRILMVDCQSGCAGAAGDGTATGALNADEATVSIALSTYAGADLNFTSGGTLVGTVVAEASNNGGTVWFAAVFVNPTTGVVSTSLTNPASGDFVIHYVGSASHVRVRVDTFTSGSTTANLRTTATAPTVNAFGSDGTNLRMLRTATDGTLRVDPTGTTTQPVSGTVTANAGSGTFTVGGTVTANQGTPNTTANRWPVQITDGTDLALVTAAGAVVVDGSAVTQPVSGTVTANAGVNLNTSALALDASVAGLSLTQGAATAGQKAVLVEGAVTTAAPTYTTGNSNPLSLTTAGLLRVDGSGVTQPVSGTITVGTFPDNEPINVAQMNGVAVTMGNGVSGTGVQRVTIASDSTGTVNVVLPNEDQQTRANSISVVMASNHIVCPSRVAISQTADTQVITGSASNFIYICSIALVAGTAETINIIEGTGSVCATSPAALYGSTTEANGLILAANGGFAQAAAAPFIRTQTANTNLCITQVGTARVAGTISYVIAP